MNVALWDVAVLQLLKGDFPLGIIAYIYKID
jgi:hypothetical protein